MPLNDECLIVWSQLSKYSSKVLIPGCKKIVSMKKLTSPISNFEESAIANRAKKCFVQWHVHNNEVNWWYSGCN